jgi:hypothetical protein
MGDWPANVLPYRFVPALQNDAKNLVMDYPEKGSKKVCFTP